MKRNTWLLQMSVQKYCLLKFIAILGSEVNYPIVVRCDNVGAIFLGYNTKTSPRTKHVDIKAHFDREYVNDEIIKIVL